MSGQGLESELARVPVENGGNGGIGHQESIKFGTHGSEPIIVEPKTEANVPKDAVDEWPEVKQVHSLYFVKYRSSYDDPVVRAQLEKADKELQKLNNARTPLIEKLRPKREEVKKLIEHMRALKEEKAEVNKIMDSKRKEIEPLQNALGKMRGSNNTNRERGGFICSSEEELNNLIKSLQYRIQHESIPLSEEKQIMKEIKQLEGTREKVQAKEAEVVRLQLKMGHKEAIQDQVKLIGDDLDGARKDRQVVWDKLKRYEDQKQALDVVIKSLDDDVKRIDGERAIVYSKITNLRKQRDDGNTNFRQNRLDLQKARELAQQKDVKALQEFHDSEVEKFMSLWNSDKAFREDYEKRILSSLDIRQLSRDGRMRNPDEKPLVAKVVPVISEPEASVKPKVNQTNDTTPIQKDKNSKDQKEAVNNIGKAGENSAVDVENREEEVFGLEKKAEKKFEKTEEVDEAKLKEMKREEEAAKAKQALERKKKLAEKAAAKAAAKAQKEAEKKLKEREKKAKKKNGPLPHPDPEEVKEPTTTEEDVAEPEKSIDEDVSAPVRLKGIERKENVTRHRARVKGPESLPKVLLKRKKSTNYWYWVAPIGVCVLLLLVIGYNYL